MATIEGYPGLIEEERPRLGRNPRIRFDGAARSFSFSASGRPRTREEAIHLAWSAAEGTIDRVIVPYVDIERERGRQITTSLRRKGFTEAQKREVKLRDGRCVGNGRYGTCDGDQPLALCQVDHIDPDGPNAIRNGQTLCGNCHDWKTAAENGWWSPDA